VQATTIIYGSTTGNTEHVANLIARHLRDGASVKNVAQAAPDDFEQAGLLVFGLSTWDDGRLQDDWAAFFPRMDEIDLTGKTVALFGLGDAFGFSGQFVNALRTLYDKVVERGGTVIGQIPVDGYDFEDSAAVVDGQFVGLVIDMENQPELTEARVDAWISGLRARRAT
jgi:flavodoxin I